MMMMMMGNEKKNNRNGISDESIDVNQIPRFVKNEIREFTG
jgi:hypothetical protein